MNLRNTTRTSIEAQLYLRKRSFLTIMPERKRNNACPFIKRDGTKCAKMVAGAFCSAHSKSQQARFARSQAPSPEPQVVPQTPKASATPLSTTLDSLTDEQKMKLLKLLSD